MKPGSTCGTGRPVCYEAEVAWQLGKGTELERKLWAPILVLPFAYFVALDKFRNFLHFSLFIGKMQKNRNKISSMQSLRIAVRDKLDNI